MLDWSERAVSFGGAARDYDRYRMAPPPEVLDWLLPADTTSVLDIGAGTGLLTRRLTERFSDVLAVEPDARMREVLADGSPEVDLYEGTGESIPLPDGRVDAALVSAAWHWMEPARALPEIARVLKPGGRFGVLYTRRDRRVPWVADLETAVRAILDTGDGVEAKIEEMARSVWLPEGAPFADLELEVVSSSMTVTSADLTRMFGTYSRFITQTEETKRELAARIEEQVREKTGAGDETIELPLACHCWRMRSTRG